MRYWVYINDKVMGPYEESQIPQLDGFTPDTLICSEVIEEGASQEWVKASSVIHIPDATTDAVSERHLDTGTGTATYIAASDVSKRPAQTTTVDASQAAVNAALLEQIAALSKQIERLNNEVQNLSERTSYAAPLPLQNAGHEEDPFEKAITELDTQKHGDVIIPSQPQEDKPKVESIAEDNTPRKWIWRRCLITRRLKKPHRKKCRPRK
ncbi:hypothetical protein AAIR98_001765 [Elusimicrobium simillimum]|uniref:hypothetical protein n=1 Tax=Elusimicrobium simillimum TaxID=3143438 RepID=UPI003C6FC804